ncbi:hypothetical protein EV426DRAFT_570400 [Tirmania nivea]|nr:hypothetical protein EV426DRAFT_570400 [Tirmania nivea]
MIPTRSASPPQATQEIQSVTRRVRTLAERTLDRNLGQAELKEKFMDLMTNEEYVKTQFTGILSSIPSAKNQWKFLKGNRSHDKEAGERVGALADAQVQIIEQATDSELAAWGVTREEAKDELRYEELERLGRIYKSAVVKRQNNNITTEKYWGPSWMKNFGEIYPPWPSAEFTRMCARVSAILSFDKGLDLLTDILPRLRAEIQARIDTPRTNKEQWVMVEDLKWVLEQDDLPPNLPVEERKYHPEYNALMVSVGQSRRGECGINVGKCGGEGTRRETSGGQ